MLWTAFGVAGCGAEPNEPDVVTLDLSMPGALGPTESVFWQIVSPLGVALAGGSADTSDPNAALPIHCVVPAGSGDVAHVTVADASGVVCLGASPPFNVGGDQTSSVAVPLSCVALDASSAIVDIAEPPGPGDMCPTIVAWKLSAFQALASGGSIDVSMGVSDPDAGDVLSYAWSATAGSFGDFAAGSARYICGQSGLQVLSVSISDNHAPTPCVVNVTFAPVTCN